MKDTAAPTTHKNNKRHLPIYDNSPDAMLPRSYSSLLLVILSATNSSPTTAR
jgi:hypothetical protein